MLRATTACTFSTSQLPRMVRARCALHILTSQCASVHGAHAFCIPTSKSAPSLVRFVHLASEICFPPQLRALSSTSQLPKVVWSTACIVRVDFELSFTPQRRAIFHLSSGQLAPHRPRQRAYVSTFRSLKSLEKKHGVA